MIGIFGGTFDPVHFGHIKPALSIKQSLTLTQLRFIPNANPPHRDPPWLSVEQRVSLLEVALREYSDVVIDKREINRAGPSYMVDTLASLRHDYPAESLCLIIGMDAFMAIPKWYQWRSLFDLCHLVVTTRPGFDEKQVAQQMTAEDYQFLSSKIIQRADALSSHGAGKILLKSVPQLDISSTQIRASLLNNQDVSEWLPKQVAEKLRGFK